jgi:hypothetical protein
MLALVQEVPAAQAQRALLRCLLAYHQHLRTLTLLRARPCSRLMDTTPIFLRSKSASIRLSRRGRRHR